MFQSLFTLKRIPLGDTVVALMQSEPAASIGALLKRQEKVLSVIPERERTFADAGLFALALLIDRWEGDDVPHGDLWPPLREDKDILVRIEVLTHLPLSMVKILSEEAGVSLGLSRAEKDSSGGPSEPSEDGSLDTQGPSTATPAE